MAIRTYKITLDSKNAIAPEPVYLRQGDKTGAVVIDATLMDNGSPVSLNGITPMFKANTADGQAVIADSTGFMVTDSANGKFTYQVPSQLGSVDGKIQIAYFSFSDSYGDQSTFNVVFVVERAADMTQESAKDWVSNLNEIISQYNQWVNDANSSWQDFVNANKEIIESVDPGGALLTEVIDARRPTGSDAYDTLKQRLDAQDDAIRDKVSSSQFELSATLATMRRLGRFSRKQGTVPSTAQAFAGLGNTTVVQYFQAVAPLDEQTGSLMRFDVVTGEVAKETTIHGYHGNSMTYCSTDKMLYFAPGEDTTGVSTDQLTQVFKIDPATLLVTDKIELSGKTALTTVHSIGYDDVDHCFVVADNNTLEFYDDSWILQFSLSFTDLLGYTPDYMQGVQCNGSVLYWIGGRKSQIWTFTIDYNGKTVHYQTTYSFEDYQENIYPTAEIEGLAFNQSTGEIYVSSHMAVGNWDGVTQYFVTNKNWKVAFSGSRLVSSQVARSQAIQVWVGTNNEYNPDGSYNHPFSNLLEATLIMRSPYLEFPDLHFKNDFDDTLILTDLHGAMITTGGAKVRAVAIINSDNLYFDSISTTGVSSFHNNALYSYASAFRVNALSSTGVSSDIKNGVYLERSNAFIGSVTGTNIYMKNSVLQSVASIGSLSKENASATLNGETLAVTATSIAGIASGMPTDYTAYQKISIIATIKTADIDTKFYSTRRFDAPIVDLWDYRMYKGQLYMGMVHLVVGNTDNSTFNLWKISNGSMVEQTVTSMSIAVMLGD